MVDLALNSDLIRAVRCRDALDALEIASGKMQFPDGWFQWLAETPLKAAELQLAHYAEVLARG